MTVETSNGTFPIVPFKVLRTIRSRFGFDRRGPKAVRHTFSREAMDAASLAQEVERLEKKLESHHRCDANETRYVVEVEERETTPTKIGMESVQDVQGSIQQEHQQRTPGGIAPHASAQTPMQIRRMPASFHERKRSNLPDNAFVDQWKTTRNKRNRCTNGMVRNRKRHVIGIFTMLT